MQFKKYIFAFIILVFAILHAGSSYSQSSGLSISMSTEPRYGSSQLLTGTLSITAGKLSSDVLVKAYINNNKKTELPIKDLLDAALITYNASQPEYGLLSGQLSSSSSSKFLGLKVQRNIIKASMKITGSTSNLSIDIGNDGSIDWQYFNPGKFTWSDQIYPEGASSSIRKTSERVLVNPQFERCEEIQLDFNPAYDSSTLQVIAEAAKTSPGSNLRARIEDLGDCDLPEPSNLNNLTTVGCEIELTSPESGLYNVCLYTDSGSSTGSYYQLPVADLPDSKKYYFIRLRKSIFSTQLTNSTIINDDRLLEAINNHFNTCFLDESANCLIPIRIKSDSAVSISKIEVIDDSGLVYSSVYELKYTPPIITINGMLDIPLEALNILAPNSVRGNNKLEISIAGKSQVAYFDTVPAPIAKLSASKLSPALLEQVSFDGSKSTPSSSGNIANYDWDFGDGTSLTTSQPYSSHSFASAGRQLVKLSVTDSSGVKSSPASIFIDVLPAEQSVDSLLSSTLAIINHTSFLESSDPDVRNVAANLAIPSAIAEAFKTLTGIEIRISNIRSSDLSLEQKEEEYKPIITQIKDIQDTIPSVIVPKSSLTSTQSLDFSSIPNPKTIEQSIQDIDAAKLAIYSLLSQHTIKMEARLVDIRYISGKEQSIVLIKKSIDSKVQPSYIAEYSPSGFSSLITPGQKINDQTVKYAADTKEIVYTLSGNIIDARDTATITMPDISSIPVIPEAVCGDGICSFNEELGINEANKGSQDYCQIDCKRDIRFGNLILIILLTGLGVYYINFYHGPWNFRDASNFLSVSLFRRRLFTSKQDLVKLSDFIKVSLGKGFTKEQLTSVLLKKGWKEEQVKAAFKSVK